MVKKFIIYLFLYTGCLKEIGISDLNVCRLAFSHANWTYDASLEPLGPDKCLGSDNQSIHIALQLRPWSICKSFEPLNATKNTHFLFRSA